jgi:Ni,Fe-hydrogenase maturation factor
VVLGVEPKDILTLSVEMTPTVEARVDDMMDLVLRELEDLGVTAKKRSA